MGRALFWLARKTLTGKAPAAAMTHRATELSLGLAPVIVEDLMQRLVQIRGRKKRRLSVRRLRRHMVLTRRRQKDALTS